MRTLLGILAFLATVEVALAQEVVALPVTVTDANGLPVLGLESSDFLIFEGGEPVEVERFESPDIALNIALVVDSSPRQDSDIDRTRSELKSLVRALDTTHSVTLIEAQVEALSLTELTTDHTRLEEAIDFLNSTGSPTNRVIDATTEAIVTLLQTGSPRSAVVVVTDGIDVGSNRNLEEFQRVLRLATIPMYVLAVDNLKGYTGNLGASTAGPRAGTEFRGALAGLAASMERVYYDRRDQWRDLAETSGGGFFDTEDEGSLSEWYDELMGRLHATYTFYYYSDGGQGLVPVDVRVNHPGAQVHAPEGIWFLDSADAN